MKKIKLKELSDKIKVIDQNLKEVEDKMEYLLMRIPNVPHPEVPQGETDEDNVEVRTWERLLPLILNLRLIGKLEQN